jgi:hypothetical protein
MKGRRDTLYYVVGDGEEYEGEEERSEDDE